MALKCVGVEQCGRCLTVCPHGAITESDGKVAVDRALCDDCGDCARACPSRALYLCGEDYTVDRLMERVLRDKPFFDTSGGGVTLSGGECLYQADFAVEFLRRCKDAGIHTAVDTTGHAPFETIERVLPYTELFLYDLKNMDSDLHRQGTGVPNELILENAVKIARAGGKMQIRIPVMTLYNDSVEMFERYGAFIASLGDAVTSVQLLPYHNLGVVKWERLGRTPDLAGGHVVEITPPTDELMNARKAQLEGFGLTVTVH
jgi:pyruvate formate lyase activating enzyme